MEREWSRKPGRAGKWFTYPVATPRVVVDRARDPPRQNRSRVLRWVHLHRADGTDRLGYQRPGLITGARQQELTPGGRGTDPILEIRPAGVAQPRRTAASSPR
jgi:hypothetical protein